MDFAIGIDLSLHQKWIRLRITLPGVGMDFSLQQDWVCLFSRNGPCLCNRIGPISAVGVNLSLQQEWNLSLHCVNHIIQQSSRVVNLQIVLFLRLFQSESTLSIDFLFIFLIVEKCTLRNSTLLCNIYFFSSTPFSAALISSTFSLSESVFSFYLTVTSSVKETVVFLCLLKN